VGFAAALSVHPLATHAVGETVGHVLDTLGTEPDLVILFAGTAHTGALDDIAASIRHLLQPAVLVGTTTSTVIGGRHEVDDGGGLSLLAATGVAAQAFRTAPADLPAGTTALLALADPFSAPIADLLRDSPVPVVGGLASAARGPGGSRLVLDGAVHTDGAAVVALGNVAVESIVSQGCRPVGAPLIVTRASGTLVEELAGEPALARVRAILSALSAEDVALARHGLHLGRVVDESKATFDRGDFVVGPVLGADKRTGAVAVADEVTVGTTVQLHLRDAATAAEDLRALLRGQGADAALLFTCQGRGTGLFGVPHHDAGAVSDALDDAPLAGMSCAGELGPVGGRSLLHGLSASVALLHAGPVPGGPRHRGYGRDGE